MTRVYRGSFAKDWRKCPGCNWQVQMLYTFPGHEIEEEGLCASCFLDMIVEEAMEVSSCEPQRRRDV